MTSLLYLNEENVNSYTEDNIIFKDLNLDDIIFEILRYAKMFKIKPYFYKLLKNPEDVLYRHEVFKDLENQELFDTLNMFSYTLTRKLRDIEDSKALKYEMHRKIKLKQKIFEYLSILEDFKKKMDGISYSSRAIKRMVEYINNYLNSEEVLFVYEDMKKIDEEMKNVKYRLYFDSGVIKIEKADDKELVLDKITDTLSKYKVENVVEFTRDYGSIPNHFLGQIYAKISRYYPIEFKHLDLFSKHFNGFIDKTISAFANDIQFYIAYIEMMKKINSMNLKFTYPKLDGNVYCNNGYDLALAISFYVRSRKVVTNDFRYDDGESVIVVSGPNQGGKTTFSRYVGQTFYLAALGLPVTGSEASIPLISNIFTMYEVEEESSNLNGKLKSELIRIKDITDNMDDNSLLIMNEVFASTSLEDGIILGKKVIDIINNKKSKALFVTFIEELASYNSTTVSMGSTVDKDDPSIRTFEILRRNDNSNTYARSIAKKNHVSYEDIIRRIG